MRVADLGRKLKYVKSVSAFAFLSRRVMRGRPAYPNDPVTAAELAIYLREGRIAKEIGVTNAQWSRMKKGVDPVDEVVLSALSTYFDLDRIDEPHLWELPFGEFQAVLRSKHYGKLREMSNAFGLGDILRGRASTLADVLTIVKVGPEIGQRGIGGLPDPKGEGVVDLHVGDRVRIEIRLDEWVKQILVFSEEPSGEFIVLLPSRDRPTTDTRQQLEILPREDTSYPVTRPLGVHWLYAIFSTIPLIGRATELDFSRSPYAILPDEAKRAIDHAVRTLPEEELAVACKAYEVSL
jgi:Domain of unknown function (DUF4384)